MDSFQKRYGTTLKGAALILMLIVPFLLYTAAMHGSILHVKLILGLFGVIMLYVMKNG